MPTSSPAQENASAIATARNARTCHGCAAGDPVSAVAVGRGAGLVVVTARIFAHRPGGGSPAVDDRYPIPLVRGSSLPR
ncbi:Uncharacterised protein [Mycobacteroides abscessus]|nr:Uncharacterised protein [Mycobacteroides abscessus]